MAHGSGVISGPTGGAQRGDNGNNATGRRNGEGKRRGVAEPACSPARRMRRNRSRATGAVQRGPRNEGSATGAAQRGQPGGSSP